MFDKILIATDGSPAAGKAISTAADLAMKCQSKLLIAHIMLHGKVPEHYRDWAASEHLAEEPPIDPSVAELRLSTGLSAGIGVDAYRSWQVFRVLGEHILSEAKNTASKAGCENVETILKEGDPAMEIAGIAETQNADLLIAGSRGLGGIGSVLLGSVSQKLLHLAPCSCLVVR